MFESERKQMVEFQLKRRGISDESVLDAMLHVPRHIFLPETTRSMAYGDFAVPITNNQTMSQPYMAAIMLELLEINKSDRVLEVGSGSGYVLALLSKLARKAIGIERIPELAEKSRDALRKVKADNIIVIRGDGSEGKMQYAPYDKILVSAAVPETPKKLLDQLKTGGILVAPIGSRMQQRLVKIVKNPNGFKETYHDACAFVPLIGKGGFEL
jgi:protein-L-isoaspartate(D-aspartate) O-methyltransferase